VDGDLGQVERVAQIASGRLVRQQGALQAPFGRVAGDGRLQRGGVRRHSGGFRLADILVQGTQGLPALLRRIAQRLRRQPSEIDPDQVQLRQIAGLPSPRLRHGRARTGTALDGWNRAAGIDGQGGLHGRAEHRVAIPIRQAVRDQGEKAGQGPVDAAHHVARNLLKGGGERCWDGGQEILRRTQRTGPRVRQIKGQRFLIFQQLGGGGDGRAMQGAGGGRRLPRRRDRMVRAGKRWRRRIQARPRRREGQRRRLGLRGCPHGRGDQDEGDTHGGSIASATKPVSRRSAPPLAESVDRPAVARTARRRRRRSAGSLRSRGVGHHLERAAEVGGLDVSDAKNLRSRLCEWAQ